MFLLYWDYTVVLVIAMIHMKKDEKKCTDLGCCYQKDESYLKRQLIASGGPIYAMMAEKMIPPLESPKCFLKAEKTLMMDDLRCMPKREEKQCGQPGLAPFSTR